MTKKKNVTIIGAGIGGITTAIYLSRNGFNVTLFEKNAFPGGRCGYIFQEGHRFDVGATLLMMPDTYKSIFTELGKNLEDELELIRMDPIYKLKFHDQKELLFTSDLVKMKGQFEVIEPGSHSRFLDYMSKSYRVFKLSMENIIEKNYYSPFDFFNLKNLILFARINAFKNHYRQTSRYFKSEIIRAALTFQNIYVGQNPFKAPAVFAMLPFMELNDGVWFPKGGMGKIIECLVSVALENGVKISYNSAIKEIKVENNHVQGVLLEDGSYHNTDIVISNADLPYVYNELLPASKYRRRINRLNYTCSAIVFHWAMDIIYPDLEQHTIFVSKNYHEGITSIFNKSGIPDDPCFYVHSPGRSDYTAAPEGQDSITVILPVSHLGMMDDTSSDDLKVLAKKVILNRLEAEGLIGFNSHIKFERCYTQYSWKDIFNLSHGAIFGSLNHEIFQMGYFRPHNMHPKYKNLFFVGGSTHPGNGVPMSLISAKLTAEKVIKQFN